MREYLEKRYQIQLKLHLITNRKSHMGFPLTPRSMTLNCCCNYFATFLMFRRQ